MFVKGHWVGVALAMSWLVGGCGDDPRSTSSMAPAVDVDAGGGGGWLIRLVGAVEDTDVRLAVLLGRGKARLYFCGGPESYATATRWFNVWYDGGEHVDFEEETWRVHAHLTAAGLSGEVELGDGVTRWVDAELLTSASVAGLYEGQADCGRVGLIVSQAPADAAPTAQGACIDSAGQTFQQVMPSSPITEPGDVRVQDPGRGDATLLLQAATLEPL